MANLSEHNTRQPQTQMQMQTQSQTQGQAQAQAQAQMGLDHQSFEPTNSTDLVNRIPNILPHERVFPIQIGSELFKLSGASISSDGNRPVLVVARFMTEY